MRYLVERDKLFLDPHLSLNRLSTITGTNTLYLSRAINVCTGHNFKTMLNDYRIEFAEALLKNNAAPRFSFKEFHTQCGFLSKSAFYSAFKKRMNMTPKEYLGLCMENADFSGGGEIGLPLRKRAILTIRTLLRKPGTRAFLPRTEGIMTLEQRMNEEQLSIPILTQNF